MRKVRITRVEGRPEAVQIREDSGLDRGEDEGVGRRGQFQMCFENSVKWTRKLVRPGRRQKEKNQGQLRFSGVKNTKLLIGMVNPRNAGL